MPGITSWIASTGLVLGLLGPAPAVDPEGPAEPPAEPPAQEPVAPVEPPVTAVERAQQHFAAEEWDEAIEALVEAYATDPQPAYLYARAQAERMRGSCKPAIALYERFLQSGPPEQQSIDTQRHIRRCEEILFDEQLEANPEPPPPVAAPLAEDPSRPLLADEPEEPRRPGRDPLGLGLIISGSGVTFGGLIVLAVGSRDRSPSAPSTLFTEDECERQQQQIRRRTILGLSLTGVGASLILGGVVRIGVLRRRQRATASAWLTPNSGGLALRGRF